jgi:glycosyltransferase involved in cell wall biosynthesis
MFVYNTVRRDRRVLKEAESLRRAGWQVTIIGLSLPSDPQPLYARLESGVVIRRVPLSLTPPRWRRTSRLRGIRRRLQRRHLGAARARAVGWIRRQSARARRPGRRERLARWLAAGRRPRAASRRFASAFARLRSVWRAVPNGVGAVGATAVVLVYGGINRLLGGDPDWYLNARQRWGQFERGAVQLAPPADVYHGHDLSGIGAAEAARRARGSGAVLYDAHELYVEAGSLATRSRWLKWLLRRRERRAYRHADAVVTVNGGVARELQRRYGRRDITVVQNCVSPATTLRPDRIRPALGLAPGTPVALYQGALTEVRGLLQAVDAIRRHDSTGAHLVFMGFGPLEDPLRALAAEAESRGKIHVLPPVDIDELDDWVASADVCLMTNLPAGRNEVLSTPNKLFESIAAGVPVVTSDFPERRAIVLDPDLGPLGAVCDPGDPGAIAAAISSVLSVDEAARSATRERCRNASIQRWNWHAEAAKLIEAYDGLLAHRQQPAARRTAQTAA